MGKKLSLGRGLDALFSENELPENSGVRMLRLSSVEPKKDQPRKIFSEQPLDELAESIRQSGVIQPILVREAGEGKYEIIAGERRWRAARKVGLTEIPAILMEADDRLSSEISLIENLQRENLTPLEEAGAYRALMDEYGLTQEKVAEKVGKSRSAIANALRLLDLPQSVREKIASGALSAGHARALASLSGEEAEKTADECVAKGWSVRQTEEAVRKRIGKRKTKRSASPSGDRPDYLGDLERRARESSGRLITISERKKQITVDYQDNEDLALLLERICEVPMREG